MTITEEKAPPCEATIDNNFEEGEVIVTLMREQSAARQEYTAADFPGVDIEEIRVVAEYFPKGNNHILLRLMLTQKDKSSVIEAIKTLEQNPIVLCANPSFWAEVIEP